MPHNYGLKMSTVINLMYLKINIEEGSSMIPERHRHDIQTCDQQTKTNHQQNTTLRWCLTVCLIDVLVNIVVVQINHKKFDFEPQIHSETMRPETQQNVFFKWLFYLFKSYI
uniref:Uncharacterized protein n=1 Tax=Nelumbo nucifera TaxID=4432 RepID=A0A822YUK9_NELNU|nr:TPA_asm: hypothetical protein HUJ06_006877 [Nelumbo nucifera]